VRRVPSIFVLIAVVPLLAFGVGGNGRGDSQQIGMGYNAAAGLFELIAQRWILHNGRAATQAGDVERFAWRHEGDGALGNLWIQRGKGNMFCFTEQQIAVDLVGADHHVVLQTLLCHAL